MRNIFTIGLILYGAVYGLNGVMVSTMAEGVAGPHGGQVIKSDNTEYEIVNNIRENKIQVYAPSRCDYELPSSLVVKVKKNNTIIDRLHLTLDPDTGSNMPSYSSRVPANISISGGITYEIDF